MTERLKNKIEDIYQVFSKYSATDMTGSELWEDKLPIWNKEIFSKPLRELSDDDLSLYAGKAITTWGNGTDYKHFLPRILELTAELRPPYEIDIAFYKMKIAEFKNWSEEEQNLIDEFMLALWESIVNDNDRKAEFEFNSYFSAIIVYYPNFTDLLEIWKVAESKGAIKHLANFIVKDSHLLFKGRGLLEDKPNKQNEFTNWLLSDFNLEKLQRKYFEFESEQFAEKISWAEKIIEIERKNNPHNKTYEQ